MIRSDANGESDHESGSGAEGEPAQSPDVHRLEGALLVARVLLIDVSGDIAALRKQMQHLAATLSDPAPRHTGEPSASDARGVPAPSPATPATPTSSPPASPSSPTAPSGSSTLPGGEAGAGAARTLAELSAALDELDLKVNRLRRIASLEPPDSV